MCIQQLPAAITRSSVYLVGDRPERLPLCGLREPYITNAYVQIIELSPSSRGLRGYIEYYEIVKTKRKCYFNGKNILRVFPGFEPCSFVRKELEYKSIVISKKNFVTHF